MSAPIITKLERDEDGVWTARLSRDGSTWPVTKRFGSWGTIPDGEGRWISLLSSDAAALQKRVWPVENRERIEREKAQKRCACDRGWTNPRCPLHGSVATGEYALDSDGLPIPTHRGRRG